MITPPEHPAPGSNRGAAIVVALFAAVILALLAGLGFSLYLLAQSWAEITPDDPPVAAISTATPRPRTPTPDPREQEPAPTPAQPDVATVEAFQATVQAELPAGVELPDIAATVQAIQSTAQAGLPGGVSLPDIAATVQAVQSTAQAGLPGAQEGPVAVTTLFQIGIPGSGPGQLDDPRGIAVGPGGEIYIAGYSDGRVQRFSPQGSFELGWRIEDERPILALAAGADGRVYVSQVPGVSVYDGASGELLDVIARGEGFEDLALLPDGSLLGIPWAGQDLVRLSPDGAEIDRIPAPLGEDPANPPVALARDAAGSLYLMGQQGGEIVVLDAEGGPRATIAVPDATFFPELAVDAEGRLYVTSLTGGIQIFDRDGALLGAVETPGFPFGLTFDAEGVLYAVTNAPSMLKLQVTIR